MQRALFIFIFGVLVAFTGLGVAAYGHVNGWWLKKQTLAERGAVILPHLTVKRPEGGNIAPVILMFDGCGHDPEQQTYWADVFVSQGYAAVIVDSFEGRDIDPATALKTVCKGRELLGSERAGDVLSVLNWASEKSWVDKDRIALAGWSHGAWAIMDYMAFTARGALPYGLKQKSEVPLPPVDKIILVYPYCGLGDQTGGNGWSSAPDIQAITVNKDSIIGASSCDENFTAIEESGVNFSHKVLDGVDHAFDVEVVAPPREGWTPLSEPMAARRATEHTKEIMIEFLERPLR